MRNSKLKSIAAKLFYLTTSLVILTVAGNSYQNALMFNRHLEREVQEQTIALAKERSAAIDGLFAHWSSELGLLVHSLGLRPTVEEQKAELAAYLTANHEVVELQVVKQASSNALQIQVAASTDDVLATAFEGRKAADVAKQLRETLPDVLASHLVGVHEQRVLLHNLAGVTKLPLVAVFFPFGVKGAKDQFWAIMVRWSSPLVAALPAASASRRTSLIDLNGQLLAAPSLDDTISGVPRAARSLVAEATAAGGSGLKLYKDPAGGEWLGAYARLKSFPATLIVERSASDQQLAASSIIRRSAIWGWAFVLLAVLVSFFGAASITSNLRSLTKATQEIAAGHLDAAVVTKGGDEVSLLGASVQNMAAKIQLLLKEQVAKAQFEKELETAEIVQNSLFPKAFDSARLQIGSFYQPASKCGGDWWGRFTCADGSEILCIGDATGHGVGAALVTAIVYACCMTAASIQNDSQPTAPFSPAALLKRINQVMWASVGGKIAMTFVAIHLDLKARRLTYANGGHNFPMIFPVDKDDQRYNLSKIRKPASETRDPISLARTHMPLGMGPEGEYEDHTIELRSRDRIVLYTDGLLECQNKAGEQWGKRRFLKALRTLLSASAQDMVGTLSKSAFEFFADEPLADDITLVVVDLPELAETLSVAS